MREKQITIFMKFCTKSYYKFSRKLRNNFAKFSGRLHSRYSFHAFSSLGLRSLITLFSQPSTTTIIVGYILMVSSFSFLKVVTNEKGEAVGDVLTIIC